MYKGLVDGFKGPVAIKAVSIHLKNGSSRKKKDAHFGDNCHYPEFNTFIYYELLKHKLGLLMF